MNDQLFATKHAPDGSFYLGVVNPKLDDEDGFTICSVMLTPKGVLSLMVDCLAYLNSKVGE